MSKRTMTGATFTFGATDYPVKKMRIGSSGNAVAEIDITDLESTEVETLIDTLIDYGSLEFTTIVQPDQLVTLDTMQGVTQTGTLTFPQRGAETGGATMVGNCALVEHGFSGEVRGRLEGTMRVRFTGSVTYTAATS